MRISSTTGIVLALCCLALYAIPARSQTVKDSWDRAERSGDTPVPGGRSGAWPAVRQGDAPAQTQPRDDAGRTVRSTPGTEKAVPSGTTVTPPPSSRAPLPESGAWQSGRRTTQVPWPSLPAHPTVQDYHAANGLVLDSLTSLYCLSTNYLRALRARNDAGLSAQTPAGGKDFAYQQRSAAPAASARPSLDALHRELLDLLDSCIRPR